MKNKIFIIVLFLPIIFTYKGYSQTSSILPDSCIGDWENAGVQGDIPHYPVGVNVKNYGAVGDGITDDTDAILNAIAACTNSNAVYFPAGSYLTTRTLVVSKSIVLRGAGSDSSRIIHNHIGNGIRLESGANWAGIEDLHVETLYAFTGASGYKIIFENIQNSWVQNIETSGYVGHNILLINCSYCEIRDSYVHNSYQEVVNENGTDGYGIELNGGKDGTDGFCAGNLIENNIVDWMRHALILQKHCIDNVYAYNFCWNNYSQSLSQTTDFEMHHPDYTNSERAVFLTLIEGNLFEQGAAQNPNHHNNTYLRNRVNNGGISINTANNAIGNELTEKKHTDSRINLVKEYKGTCIIHGNYAVEGSQQVEWDAAISDHNIPVSYYLSSKPDFFGDLEWPPYGADLMEQTSGNNKRRNPAEVRYWSILFPEVSPSNLRYNIKANEVVLTWDNNSTNEVDFIVCRSTDSENFQRIGYTYETSYTDTITVSGSYYYYVYARNHLGGRNFYGDIFSNDLGGESAPSETIIVKDFVSSVDQNYIDDNIISAYPNPATDILYFNLDDDQAQTILIYNSLGQLEIEKMYIENSVKISKLNEGVYYLIIKGIRKNYHSKFIIE